MGVPRNFDHAMFLAFLRIYTQILPRNFDHAMILAFLRTYTQILLLSGTATRKTTEKTRWMGSVVR